MTITVSNEKKKIFVPATQFIRYFTKSCTAGSDFDFSHALKTAIPLALVESFEKYKLRIFVNSRSMNKAIATITRLICQITRIAL